MKHALKFFIINHFILHYRGVSTALVECVMHHGKNQANQLWYLGCCASYRQVRTTCNRSYVSLRTYTDVPAEPTADWRTALLEQLESIGALPPEGLGLGVSSEAPKQAYDDDEQLTEVRTGSSQDDTSKSQHADRETRIRIARELADTLGDEAYDTETGILPS